MSDKVIVGMSSSIELAKKIAENTGINYINSRYTKFADGELRISMEPEIANKHVYLVQSTNQPVNDNLMELLIGIDAMKGLNVKSINVIIPYYGYARQDRQTKPGRPVTNKLKANLIKAAGANNIFLIDIHSNSTLEAFEGSAKNISAIPFLVNKFKKREIDNLVVLSPDEGSIERSNIAAEILDTRVILMKKKRIGINEVEIESKDISDDVKNKNILIIDDMVDTAGTISESIKKVKEMGANNIYIIATHAVLSNKENRNNEKLEALEKMFNSGANEFITSNTIQRKEKYNGMTVHDISSVIKELVFD